jgi:hypothetical protein
MVKRKPKLSDKKPNLTLKQSALNRICSPKLTDFIYIGFFLVIFTHCVLALRLNRITHRLEIVQINNKPYKPAGDSKWINHKMNNVHLRLDQLKGEVQDYDQRILKLKSNI